MNPAHDSSASFDSSLVSSSTVGPDAVAPRDLGGMAVRRDLAALRPELFARALRLTRSRSRADDLVQDTMVRALRFEHQFKGGTNLRAWVGQVLTSVFLSGYRSDRRARRAMGRLAVDPCAWTEPVAAPSPRALSPSVERALAALPQSYRDAVLMVDLEEQSYRDAAARAGVPFGTIMSRLHRARKELARRLDEDAPREVSPRAT
jgi:RNA polymerase sigma-70 factor (ECF subfamily)